MVAAHDDGSGAMFDRIAGRYDLLNRLNSLGLDQGWRRRTAKALVPAGAASGALRILDVAAGTGDLAIAIARHCPAAMIRGVDTSASMTAIGSRKVERAGLAGRVCLDEGDAQNLAFPDESFDAAAIAFGIRNVPDRLRALCEMARVTRPGGRVAVLELGEPESGPLAALARLQIRVVVPLMGALLAGAGEYRYLRRSIRACPPARQFARTMASACLRSVEAHPLTGGVCTLFLARRPAGDAGR